MYFAHGELVTVLRGSPILDPYSHEETGRSWTDPTPTPYPKCAVYQNTTEEPTEDGRNSVRTATTVLLPANADITARDRVVVRGQTFEIDGDPFPWHSPFTGWEPGTQVTLGKVVG